MELPKLRVITGGKDKLVERLTGRFPNIFLGLKVNGISFFQDLDSVSPNDIEKILHQLPETAPGVSHVRDLMVYFAFHPLVIQIADIQAYYRDPATKPTLRIGSSVYLQRTGDGLSFPSLDGFRDVSNRGSEVLVRTPSDYRFLSREIDLGRYNLKQEIGVPTQMKPTVDDLVQESISLQKFAHATAPLVISDYGGELQNPLSKDHVRRAEARLQEPFYAWTRIEGPHEISNDPFRLDEITDELARSIFQSFSLTIEISEGIAGDYIRFRNGDPDLITTVGYYGGVLSERTFGNTTKLIRKYLADTSSD